MNEYDLKSKYNDECNHVSNEFKLSTKKIKKLWNHSKKYGSKNEQMQYQEMYEESLKH